MPLQRPRVAAAVALLVSLNYWSGGPVWDDHSLIVGHLATLSGEGLAHLWGHPVGLGETGAAYFRPVAMTLLALLGRVGTPAVHVLAGLLHAASAAAICVLGERSRGALLGALLFAVHPVVWEVLGWASALPDVLSVALGLTLLWAAREQRPGLAAVALVLGLWSKETTLVWLVVGAVGGAFDRRMLRWVGAAGAAAIGVRVAVGVSGLPPLVDPSVTDAVRVWTAQLGTLLWAFPLDPVRDTHHISWTHSLAGVLGLAGLAVVAWRGTRWDRGLVVAVVLPPVLALPTTLTAHLAGDRYVYASLAGLALLLGRWSPPPRAVAGGLVAAGLLILSAHRVGAAAWKTDRALFSRAVEVRPQSAYAHQFSGHALALDGEWAAAADAFDRARTLPHAHPLSAQLALQAHVLAGQPSRAAELGRSGPQDGLTADWIAWWARAERDAGHPERAAALVAPLRQPDGTYAGPPFVPELAETISPRP